MWAIGLKVSDEFTAPALPWAPSAGAQTGNEEAWWAHLKINALEIARGLWEQSHPAVVAYASDTKPM